MVYILLAIAAFLLIKKPSGNQMTVATKNVNVESYRKLAEKYAILRNIPLPVILGIIDTESSGNAAAIGADNDLGLMQVTPIALADAQRFVLLPYQHYELTDPEKNIDVGTAYLFVLLNHYNLTLWDAVRAYNVGPGTAKNNPAAGQAYKETVLRNTLKYEN